MYIDLDKNRYIFLKDIVDNKIGKNIACLSYGFYYEGIVKYYIPKRNLKNIKI